MIDVYSWPTPNGHKVHIMLEECALPYRVHPINIGKGEQFSSEFAAINPNHKIPAIVDQQGLGDQVVTVFESGACLIYLAEKAGKFMPKDVQARYAVLEWLMFQMGGVGPMFGQANHFRNVAPEKIPYAIERYTQEVERICGVMDKRLMTSAYIGGAQYSIADIAIFPWLRATEKFGIDWGDYPYLQNWFDTVSARPAVQKGLQVLAQV